MKVILSTEYNKTLKPNFHVSKQIINLYMRGIGTINTGTGGPSTINAMFNINGRKINNRWLWNSKVPSNLGGFPVPRASNITKIIISSKTPGTGRFYLYKNNESSELDYIDLSASNYMEYTPSLLTLLTGDFLKLFVESSNGIDYPNVFVEFSPI